MVAIRVQLGTAADRHAHLVLRHLMEQRLGIARLAVQNSSSTPRAVSARSSAWSRDSGA